MDNQDAGISNGLSTEVYNLISCLSFLEYETFNLGYLKTSKCINLSIDAIFSDLNQWKEQKKTKYRKSG
jgi:hypothetical protein